MGAGWMTADYERAGMALDRAGTRIARLAEAITVMKGCFADGAVLLLPASTTPIEWARLPTRLPTPALIRR